MGEHAKLSASQSERWMPCPGSVALSDTLPRQPSSHAANEGTAAHELAEMCLKGGMQPIEMVGRIIKVTDDVTKETEEFEVDEDMCEAVTVYTDWVAQELAKRPNASFHIEKKFDLTWLRPNMFGTNDVSIFDPGEELTIGDYKHGKGVLVEVKGNKQLKYYGLGGLKELINPKDLGKLLDHPDCPKQIRLVIIQPRARHKDGPIRSEVIPTAELWKWRIELAKAADETLEENATIKSGEHCRWCPATGICPELRGTVEQQAQLDFADPVLALPGPHLDQRLQHINPEDLSQSLNALPVVEMWCKGVAAAAQSYLENGGELTGYKLVRKKTNRKWKDEKDALSRLNASELSKDEYLTEPKLKGPAQIEKVKRPGAKEFVAEHAFKPEGGYTWALDIDPRPAVSAPNVQMFIDTVEDIDLQVPEEDIFQ